jgi:hypothetical protein
MDKVAISISPLGEVSAIRTIDAITLIHTLKVISLFDAKRAVERILVDPVAVLPFDFAASWVTDMGFVSKVRELTAGLAQAGVALKFDGLHLGDFLGLQARGVSTAPQPWIAPILVRREVTPTSGEVAEVIRSLDAMQYQGSLPTSPAACTRSSQKKSTRSGR